MALLGTYNRPGTLESSSGIWGWTGSDGKEYALLTSRSPGGVSIVDISAPAAPRLINFIPSTGSSNWQEIHSYRDYAYKVSQENSDGLQIIHLAPLNAGKPAVLVKNWTPHFTTAHTLFVDTSVSPGRLFVAYGRNSGVMIFTLEDPENPKWVKTLEGEAHDMFARGDRLFVSNGSRGILSIYDITDLAAPMRIAYIDFGNIGSGEAKGFAHNAWLSEDGRTLFTTQETVGTTLKAFDLSDMSWTSPPKLVGKWIGVEGLIAHNCYVKGNLLYVSHYTGGLRVVDISNPAAMREIAFHRPSARTETFAGSWGAYPWFRSGIVIHGDKDMGLFIGKIETLPVSARKSPILPRAVYGPGLYSASGRAVSRTFGPRKGIRVFASPAALVD